MATIVIYTTPICPYCVRAKHLLKQKGATWTEIDVSRDAAERQALVERTRQRTVPQIFINDEHIGGCDELYALERAGRLDPLLAG
ncbi:MAG: glutaredoxin 3 [bacterium]|nr:glutaredoxin 3 [bacterium]